MIEDRMRDRRSAGRYLVILVIIAAVLVNGVFLSRYLRYQQETARLREGMTNAQRERADAVVATERHRLRVELELIRRQARGDRDLHLAVNVDSGRMVLERDGVVLREMSVRLGPDRVPGATGDSVVISMETLGERTVERVLKAGDRWEVPASAFEARGLPVPEDRRIRGALGGEAIVLTEGTVLYAVPENGPLADTSFVLPGSVQIPSADLKALASNIKPGMSVYFYR
jgi:hypothetical protein